MGAHLRTIAFFNIKGGVGKTTLIYHLAWIYADLGLRVLVVDLDPQSDLTSMLLDAGRLDEIQHEGGDRRSVAGVWRALISNVDTNPMPEVEKISSNLRLLAGSLLVSSIEEEFNSVWQDEMEPIAGAISLVASLRRMLDAAASDMNADVVLFDLAPNLGAINRAVVIASSHVVVPLRPNSLSVQSLRIVGPTLHKWRRHWNDCLDRVIPSGQGDGLRQVPRALMNNAGYVIMPNSRSIAASAPWGQKIAEAYLEAVMRQSNESPIEPDPNCVGIVRNYRSLMSIAMELGKPVFHLTPADGAIGSLGSGVRDSKLDFTRLAKELARRCRVEFPAV